MEMIRGSATRSLGGWISNIDELPAGTWLYVIGRVERVTLDMPCVVFLDRQAEASLSAVDGSANPLRIFMRREQLLAVMDDLRRRVGEFSSEQLEVAMTHFWLFDRYLDSVREARVDYFAPQH
ncbi:MAG: hypothetical protein AMXMBFR6_24740 [Betaproteobacteria bacterium]|nr:hypothetical protein [Rhodocyclaceae bacterium]